MPNFQIENGWLALTGVVLHCAITAGVVQAQTPPLNSIDLTRSPSTPVTPDSNLPMVETDDRAACDDCATYTNTDISQHHFTEPSLWWSVRELGERLVPSWVVDPVDRRVDFTIDPQRWNWMDYFERYTLVIQLAYVLRPYGYNLFIFDPQRPDAAIGSYICDFEVEPPRCQLELSPNPN